MKIEINDIDFYHRTLTTPFFDSRDDGEAWKGNEHSERQPRIIFRSSPILMPFPFIKAGLFLSRAGANYSAMFGFEANLGTDYTKFTDEMRRLYGKRWLNANRHNRQSGHGYLFAGVNETYPRLVVHGQSTEGISDQYICLGKGGAEGLPLRDINSFVEDIGLLEKVANIYCTAVIGEEDPDLAGLVLQVHSAT